MRALLLIGVAAFLIVGLVFIRRSQSSNGDKKALAATPLQTTSPHEAAPSPPAIAPQPKVKAPDAPAPSVAEEVIVKLGAPIPVAGATVVASVDLGDSPIVRFSPTGNGQALAFQPASGQLVLFAVDGSSTKYTIPPDANAGVVHDAAIGPDGVLYMSRVTAFDPAKGALRTPRSRIGWRAEPVRKRRGGRVRGSAPTAALT